MRGLFDLFRRPVRSRRTRRLLAEITQHSRDTTAAAAGRPRPQIRSGPNTAARLYGTAVRPSISPGLVRDRRFGDRTRHGFDPTEVRAFLHLVADELAALRAELHSTQEENARIKQALRDWQSQQFQQAQTSLTGVGVAA
ncbi:DivIVA domain-containing protein [Solwaraspora sp. WMMD406]|uniref:DivIVA domain-containing protein n=1 Tax=Solwaraspora sp. WMMD406 TaxID=3016095 RepID=UPI002417CCE6|nr:DivIVA domain-containing protein [Solwaraspora sp. WMMD406]MDG4768353.1 DivIVA domain-containing protein [Solwaraspora sp. WMMD406]